MNPPPHQHSARSKRCRRAMMSNPVVVIDHSDDDAPDEDLDRKPASKSSSVKNPPCISLLDSSDEENHRGMSSNNKKRKSSRSLSRLEAADRELAEKLQRQENIHRRKNRKTEKKEMTKSSDGKAVLAVQEIVALVKTAKKMYMNKPALQQHSVETVTIDDMVFFAKNMLDLQQEFIQKHIPGFIDVGYHYTDKKNMANIRTHGLLTSNDRQTNKVKTAPKGSVFGDGIYTANHGSHFSKYGDTGLIVGRLKGSMVRVTGYLPPNQKVDANTIIGDKLIGATHFGKPVGSDGWPSGDSFHEIVLRSSAQCLPMIKFDKALRLDQDGKKCVHYLKKCLQRILTQLFNQGLHRSNFSTAPLITTTPLPTAGAPNPHRVFPPNPQIFLPAPAGAAVAPPGLNHMFPPAPASLPTNTTSFPINPSRHPNIMHGRNSSAPSRTRRSAPTLVNYTAPKNLTSGIPLNAFSLPPASFNMKEKCIICHDRLKKGPCVELNPCKHVFHRNCINLALKSKPQCPICRLSIGEPQGRSPSGIMVVSLGPIRCSGFREDSIIIAYNIPSGRQLNYHDKPGKRHGGKNATSYLPNNTNGQNLLKRLKYAWLHGLSFTIGTSITTGSADQCTWASIHHKTSPSGGTRAHGYPDPNYFENCNSELDGLGVPSARELDGNGRRCNVAKC